jgi:DNA polymerase-3 subunit delta'
LQVGNHPDFSLIQPAETGKPITVDQIRDLIHFCSLTSNYGRYQITVLTPAEAMNRNAANSLLKLLEEPPPKTLFMLISHQPMALLATIRSRCQRLDFSRPDKTVTQHWLQHQIPHDVSARLLLNLTSQAPLAALELVNSNGLTQRRELFETLAQLPTGKIDPISTAEQWNKLELSQILPWMLSWTMDLIRYATCGQAHLLVNQDRRETLQRLARPRDLHNLFNLLDLETDAHRLITAGANINTQGLLETIAMAWLELGTPQRRK